MYEQKAENGNLAEELKGHCQTGIAACVSVDDYLNGVIRKHETGRCRS